MNSRELTEEECDAASELGFWSAQKLAQSDGSLDAVHCRLKCLALRLIHHKQHIKPSPSEFPLEYSPKLNRSNFIAFQ